MKQEQTRKVGQPRKVAWWLIVRDGDTQLECFTLACGNSETLPVFSFKEEAEMFLRLAGLESRWRVRLSGCGELVSMLYGPCARVRGVSLDPLPGMTSDGTIGLVSLDRDRFSQRLVWTGSTR